MNDFRENKNIIIAGLWQTRNGHYHTMPVDDRVIENFKALEKGGKFLIRKRTAESIQRSDNPDKAPVAYLEYVSPEEVARFQKSKPSPTSSGL